MDNLFMLFYQYYYVVLILQGICVFHSIRMGNQQKWIWIIIFLPLIGSIAYIFTEIVKKQHVNAIQTDVVKLVNPSGRIRDLEKKFKFSDTFANRVALADAYLQNRAYDKAIEMYEPALAGTFSDNEHVIKKLMQAYYEVGRYQDVIRLAPKVSHDISFSKSKSNLYYAFALEQAGRNDLAEKEYKAMNHRYSNYEARYYYGDFLVRNDKKTEAAQLFQDIYNEAEHMSRSEKGHSKVWIDKTYEMWKKL